MFVVSAILGVMYGDLAVLKSRAIFNQSVCADWFCSFLIVRITLGPNKIRSSVRRFSTIKLGHYSDDSDEWIVGVDWHHAPRYSVSGISNQTGSVQQQTGSCGSNIAGDNNQATVNCEDKKEETK
jgi:hypothetical protein